MVLSDWRRADGRHPSDGVSYQLRHFWGVARPRNCHSSRWRSRGLPDGLVRDRRPSSATRVRVCGLAALVWVPASSWKSKEAQRWRGEPSELARDKAFLRMGGSKEVFER